MRFQHSSMRGQSVVIHYGLNPMGEVAGVWVELGDGGRAEELTATEELAAWRLAMAHNDEARKHQAQQATLACSEVAA